MTAETSNDKPLLVALAFPAPGHMQGLLQITRHLVSRGFTVHFIAGTEFEASVGKTGAHYIENPRDWRVTRPNPADSNRDMFDDLKHVFADSTPAIFSILRDTLERLREQHPDREILILQDTMAQGVAPFKYGAALPKGYTSFPKVISFHPSIYVTKDYSIPPFGPGLPYDPTPENLAMWRSIYDAIDPQLDSLNSYFHEIYKTLGAMTPPTKPLFDSVLDMGEVTIMATTPSLEYPVANMNPKVRFVGGLPLKPLDPAYVYPEWWSTITENARLPNASPDKKHVVFVSQGTVHLDYREMITTAIAALSSREDLIVIVTLGSPGEKPPADLVIPDNTKIIDYLPYDATLPYTDVFISNAGYGGFMHGIMNGVPMVLSGAVADKAEVCARGEWAGVAVNLRSQSPSAEAIREGVDKILGNPKYKARALELKRENEERNSLESIERIVEEVWKSG
ncbi:4'-demethylrebeccamycin synthase [Madurella mycetomatis]|uniref:4'-demethylrebeccamycin synthase n=1 Tax=Madurella mycetomatis TaxID=100816 RepID=A0A175W647_9PEZI|nr:4'-demethylrebeccamycin synthase [Madurella mycetomatis]